MTFHTIMGFVSSFALFIPILLIIILKLGSFRCFAVLLIYYTSIFIYNLMTEGYINTTEDIIYNWGIANNMLDVPLMLFFLTYFSPSKLFKKRLLLLALSFTLFELIVMSITGLNVKGLTIIMGPGLIIIAGLSLHFFVRYSKIAIERNKCAGKAYIAGSLFFGYGCFSLLYVLFYILNTNEVKDTFLIYFIATSLSAIFMSIGIFIEWKRIKKIKELKITRRELSEIYKDTNMAARKRTATLNLDFDSEYWHQ